MLLGLLLVLASYALVLRSAIQSGEQLQFQRAQATQEAEIARQVRLAATDLWEGHKDRAVLRLAWVLTQTPQYPAVAGTLQAALMTTTPTPSPTPITPTPTTTPTPTRDPATAYAEAEAVFRRGLWDEAITHLRHLQVLDPTYQTARVREMLYAAYLNLADTLLPTDRIEEALLFLSEAESLGPIPQDLAEEREKAIRYLRALSYWGVDWDRTIRELELLTYQTVSYRDVFSRLVQAHVMHGDIWADKDEWCPAAGEYAQAVRLLYDATVENKRLEAALLCQSATPTPLPGQVDETVAAGPIAGLTVGKLSYTILNQTNNLYDLMVVSAANPVPIRYYSHVGQPSWRSDGQALIFKSWGEDGLLTMPAGGGSATYVLGLPADYPSFSPDGNRITFATRYYADNWQVYLAPTDGATAPYYMANGHYPIWGPGGFIAYSGCSPDGAACGIWINNPDDGEPPVRLTASLLDIPTAWSADGTNIAYMSTYDGDWDIYNVHVSGAVQQLTNNDAAEGLPAWAPDGSGLAFISNRDSSWGIYLMRPDGSEQRKIINLGTQHHNWTSERISWGR